MLFRPNFCASCGERIERVEWFPWTSRRFCQICETEFKGQDLIPKIVVGIGILVGLFGIGSYLKSGPAPPDLQALKQPRKLVEQPQRDERTPTLSTIEPRRENSNANVNGQPELRNFSSTSGMVNSVSAPKPKSGADEQLNYCGAETKKGTPCSRRVKGNTRCFQHIGMPAMASAERPNVKSQK